MTRSSLRKFRREHYWRNCDNSRQITEEKEKDDDEKEERERERIYEEPFDEAHKKYIFLSNYELNICCSFYLDTPAV